MDLRKDQQDLIDALDMSLLLGDRRIVVQAPTGWGKTRIAAAIIDRELSLKCKTLFVVPAIALVNQTVDALRAAGIDEIGVIQAFHEMTDWRQPVQVCSVQTLMRRTLPDADFVILDEVHRFFNFYAKWMLDPKWADVPFVGLSATPWRKGLGAYFTDLIIASTTKQAIADGILSDFAVFAPSAPNLKGVRTVAGDYHEGDLAERMAPLVADIVDTWLQRGEDRPTLCFAVDRSHAKNLQQQFIAKGVTADYMDAFTKEDERLAIKARFHGGETKVVCNVGVLCLDAETEILTSAGFVGINQMTMKHLVASWTESGTVFAPPRSIVRRNRMPSEDMVALEGRNHSIRVTDLHRMVWSKYGKDYTIFRAKELAGLRGFIPVSGNAAPFEYRPAPPLNRRHAFNTLTWKYRKQGIDGLLAKAMASEHHKWLNDECLLKSPNYLSFDECMFIGFWLGDGTRSQGRFSISQSMAYPKIVTWIDDLIKRIGLHCTRNIYAKSTKSNNTSIRWNFSTGRGGRDQRRVGGLAKYDAYLNKQGSSHFWAMSREQILAILHGFWLADGNHGDGETPSDRGKSICGCQLELYELIQAIGSVRGLRVTISERGTKKEWHSPQYRMSWKVQAASQIVRERFRTEKNWKAERVWCVESETGKIIIRRKGKVSVVGNCTGVDWDVRCVILARPTKSEILFCQIIGRGLRTADGKDHCLILDHSDTTARLGFVTDIHHSELNDGTSPTTNSNADKIALPKKCQQCSYLKPPRVSVCPACGFKAKVVDRTVVEAGELVHIDRVSKQVKFDLINDETFYREMLGYARNKGYSDGYAYHKTIERFGRKPPWAWKDKGELKPTAETLSYVRYMQIKYAKSRFRRNVERPAKASPGPVAAGPPPPWD